MGLFIKAVAAPRQQQLATVCGMCVMQTYRDGTLRPGAPLSASTCRCKFCLWLGTTLSTSTCRCEPWLWLGSSDRWTVLSSTNSRNIVEDSTHWDGGIADQGGWMEQNWYPFLREGEQGVAGSHATQDVVSVDEPGLVVYDSLRP